MPDPPLSLGAWRGVIHEESLQMERGVIDVAAPGEEECEPVVSAGQLG
jgi:hypothetical protein